MKHLVKGIRLSCAIIVLLAMWTSLNGCCTTLAWQKARGSACIDEKGKTTVVEKPEPAFYAIMPLAVIGDVMTLPFWITVTIGANLGLVGLPM